MSKHFQACLILADFKDAAFHDRLLMFSRSLMPGELYAGRHCISPRDGLGYSHALISGVSSLADRPDGAGSA